MSFKIAEKKMYILIATITLMLLYNIVLNTVFVGDYNAWMQLFAGIIILLYIYDIFVMSVQRIGILSLPFFFITLSYVFHLGQVFLNAFFADYTYISSNYLTIYTVELTKEALLFSLNVIQIVLIGIIMSSNNKNPKKKKMLCFNIISPRQMKFMGWVVCLITVPLKIAYTLTAISIVQNDSYLASIVAGYSGVYIQFANFCVIGFVLLLLAYSDNVIKASLVLCAEMIFLLWTMMSGGRIYAVVSIIILCYCYFSNVKKINIKNVIVLLILCWFFLQGITVITQLRMTNEFTLNTILEEMMNPSNNFILRLLDEFGGTQYTVIVTLAEVPDYIDYHMGQSYIKAWALAGVNIGGGLEQIQKDVQYTYLFSRRYSFGGTYIGELYYNFGYFAYVFAPFVGLIVAKLSNSIDYYLKNKEYVNFSLLVMPMWATLQWVRGYFDGFSRATIWGAAFIILIYSIARRIKTIRER